MLFFAATVSYADRQILGILAPILQREIGWSEAEYGIIVVAFQTAYAAGLIGVGRFVDAMGTRLGCALALAWWSFAAMAHGLVTSVFGFGFARFLLGLGEAGISRRRSRPYPTCFRAGLSARSSVSVGSEARWEDVGGGRGGRALQAQGAMYSFSCWLACVTWRGSDHHSCDAPLGEPAGTQTVIGSGQQEESACSTLDHREPSPSSRRRQSVAPEYMLVAWPLCAITSVWRRNRLRRSSWSDAGRDRGGPQSSSRHRH